MSVETLKDFTKDEIIEFLRENGFFLRISKRDLLFTRWQMQSQKALDADRAESERWDREKPDFKKRDKLAEEFNRSTRPKDRLDIINQIIPYDEAMSDHLKRCRDIEALRKKADATYKQMEKA